MATPENARFDTIRWTYHNGEYEGGYNWVNETWLAEGGGKYAEHANEASPEDQTKVFRIHANAHDWPESVPACE